MNQDNYMGESYKMRNLLDCLTRTSSCGIPGDHLQRDARRSGAFAAIAEFIFQTFQRF